MSRARTFSKHLDHAFAWEQNKLASYFHHVSVDDVFSFKTKFNLKYFVPGSIICISLQTQTSHTK